MTAASLKTHPSTPFDVQDLYKKPFITVPFDVSLSFIEASVQAFFDFLTLPMEIKTHMDHKLAPLSRRGDVGYKRREPEDDLYRDRKDFFHYHPVLWKMYPAFIEAQPKVKKFLEMADPLWNQARDTAYNVLGAFEADYPGSLDRVFDNDSPHMMLRFLRYDYEKSGAHLAKPHFDAGSFTLAIAESCPGLRIGTHPDDLTLVSHEENQALFMVSSNYQKIIETDRLHPGWHDVIQMDESKIGRPYARWAVVAFIDGHNVPCLPRSETHKWCLDPNSPKEDS